MLLFYVYINWLELCLQNGFESFENSFENGSFSMNDAIGKALGSWGGGEWVQLDNQVYCFISEA